ncbi:MAG TPA: D-arabinono-1,4-lactone oxidase, partial [Propionibacteriaceae bacterium]|nr:D-arabinono-1,4-lactone oxidase [Propionibacteriaceae bacterium]
LGGTSLAELNVCLATHGLSLENMGDIDRQTITGAISTGTHGTGAKFGGLATQVRALTMITPDGSQLRCSAAESPDLFMAARVGLGALGVITEVTLQCVPSFRLQAVEGPARLENVLDGFEDMITENDHVEFYWFPHTDRTLTKRNNRVPHDHVDQRLPRWRYLLDDELLSNGLFEGANRLGRLRPSLIPRINQLSARVLAPREFTDVSYAVFTSPRRVRFKESEYAVPRAAIAPVLRALRAWIDDHDERICFPVEVRVAAPDDIWLSTAYQRETGYIAVHHYFKIDHRRYFAAFESIVAEHQGRPHWGKMHTLEADQLRQLYPRFDQFVRIRDRLDPGHTFDNAHLRRVLGS